MIQAASPRPTSTLQRVDWRIKFCTVYTSHSFRPLIVRRGQARRVCCASDMDRPRRPGTQDRARERALRQAPLNPLDLPERHFCRGGARKLEQATLNLYNPTTATGVATCAEFAMPFVVSDCSTPGRWQAKSAQVANRALTRSVHLPSDKTRAHRTLA